MTSTRAPERAGGGSDWLHLEQAIAFELRVDLPEAAALAFVQDVGGSLRHADFLTALSVGSGAPTTVRAELPVATAMFGTRSLPFESLLELTPSGACLTPRALGPAGIGWAEVGGEARVVGAGPEGSLLDYRLDVAVRLATPSAERWGTQALLKIVEVTAANVLRRLVERFPRAIERAAREHVALGGAG